MAAIPAIRLLLRQGSTGGDHLNELINIVKALIAGNNRFLNDNKIQYTL